MDEMYLMNSLWTMVSAILVIFMILDSYYWKPGQLE